MSPFDHAPRRRRDCFTLFHAVRFLLSRVACAARNAGRKHTRNRRLFIAAVRKNSVKQTLLITGIPSRADCFRRGAVVPCRRIRRHRVPMIPATRQPFALPACQSFRQPFATYPATVANIEHAATYQQSAATVPKANKNRSATVPPYGTVR